MTPFTKRSPPDVLLAAVGRAFHFDPAAGVAKRVIVTEIADMARFSLGTRHFAEVKARPGRAAATMRRTARPSA
jgi:hypothetical protein